MEFNVVKKGGGVYCNCFTFIFMGSVVTWGLLRIKIKVYVDPNVCIINWVERISLKLLLVYGSPKF